MGNAQLALLVNIDTATVGTSAFGAAPLQRVIAPQVRTVFTKSKELKLPPKRNQENIMKKFLTLIVALMFSQLMLAQTVVWNSNRYDPSIGSRFRVVFSNGLVIERSKDGRQLYTTDFDGNNKEKLLENNATYIETASPNVRNADFALISDNCGAPACYSGGLYLVIPEGKTLSYFQVGDPQKLTITFDQKTKNLKAQAEKIYAGEDKYGSAIYDSYEYLEHKGFVKKGLKSAYLKIIGKRPDDFFSDEVMRKPLLSKMDAEDFKDLRRSMEVGNESRILNGRFLLLVGCLRYSCFGNYGAVLIDLEANEFYWANFSLGKKISGTTVKSAPKENVVSKIKSAIYEQSPYEDMSIGMTGEGSLVFEKKKFSSDRFLKSR